MQGKDKFDNYERQKYDYTLPELKLVKNGYCFNSHINDIPQVAQRNVSIVAHIQYPFLSLSCQELSSIYSC